MTNSLNHENKLPVSGILQVQVQRSQQQQSALGHHGNQCVSPGTLRSVETVSSPFILADNKTERHSALPCPLRGCLAGPRAVRMPVSIPGEIWDGGCCPNQPECFLAPLQRLSSTGTLGGGWWGVPAGCGWLTYVTLT